MGYEACSTALRNSNGLGWPPAARRLWTIDVSLFSTAIRNASIGCSADVGMVELSPWVIVTADGMSAILEEMV